MYWDGVHSMSWLQTITVQSFHKLNPDWEIFVYVPNQAYTGKDNYITSYTGNDYFDVIKRLSFVTVKNIDVEDYGISLALHDILRSDILRYRVLHDVGGMWSDFDVIWIRPMSLLCGTKYIGAVDINEMGAHATLRYNDYGHHNIGILLSVPGHDIYKLLLDECDRMQNKKRTKLNHQEFGILLWGRLFPELHSVVDKYQDVVGLQYQAFAPYAIDDLDRLYKRTDLSVLNKNVIGMHWFNGHPLSKEYINQNDFERPCSMTEIIKTYV